MEAEDGGFVFLAGGGADPTGPEEAVGTSDRKQGQKSPPGHGSREKTQTPGKKDRPSPRSAKYKAVDHPVRRDSQAALQGEEYLGGDGEREGEGEQEEDDSLEEPHGARRLSDSEEEYRHQKMTALAERKRRTTALIKERNDRVNDEISQHHRPIRLPNRAQFCTLFCCRRCSGRRATALYEVGLASLRRDLELTSLIKNQKKLLTLARCIYLTSSRRWQLLGHTREHLLDLDPA